MLRPDPPTTTTPRQRLLLVLTVVGVVAYVATWAVLGIVAEGYDPLRDAISELFDLGAPVWQRRSTQGAVQADTAIIAGQARQRSPCAAPGTRMPPPV